MVDSLKKPSFEELRPGVKVPAKETLLTPRFYTTDFDEMAQMDISINEDELRAILEEFRADYNRHHFVRDEQFEQSWDHISGETRHAGFLNKAMSDFNLQLDLGFLTKSKKYTFFKPKFIFYATYLSEKIGYWRYITIYRHLEKHPEDRIYPIFRFFENWCQDENRHGDFFDAIMKAQPQFLNDWKAKLWSRFFLLSVFATMYLNDIQRADFYASLGLDAREYDKYVIEKTNETSARVFPVILDVDKAEFYDRLEICIKNNEKLGAIASSNSPKFLQFFQKLPLYVSNGWQFLRLYLMKPIETASLQGVAR